MYKKLRLFLDCFITGSKLPTTLTVGFLCLFLTGCHSNRITPEIMEKQLAGFQLPETPKQNKALIYFIYNGISFPVPKEISLSYAKNDKERYESEKNQYRIVLNIFTFGLSKDPQITHTKNIGTLKPGEYRTFNLEPGYYNFRYEVVIPYGIDCNPNTRFLKLEAGKIYYLLLEWDAFYNRYTQELVQNLYLRSASDELTGRYKLSKNFKKAD